MNKIISFFLAVISLFSALILLCPLVYAEMADDSILWSFDPEDICTQDGTSLSVLSVSPSGRYIAAADRTKIDKNNRNAAGAECTGGSHRHRRRPQP